MHIFKIQQTITQTNEKRVTPYVDYLTKPTITTWSEMNAHNERNEPTFKPQARIRKNLYMAIFNTLSINVKSRLVKSILGGTNNEVVLAA